MRVDLDLFFPLYFTVARVESHYNINALHFEPETFRFLMTNVSDEDYYKKPIFMTYVSRGTFYSLLSYSYGEIQVMGYNIFDTIKKHRIMVFKDIEEFREELKRPFWRFVWFLNFLHHFNLKDIVNALIEGKETEELEQFAVSYNGKKHYAKLLLSAFKNRDYTKELELLNSVMDDLYEAWRIVK